MTKFIDISNTSEEYRVIRYSGLIYSSDPYIRKEGFENLICIAKHMNWVFYLEEITSQLSNDKVICSSLEHLISKENIIDSNAISNIETLNTFFSKICQKDFQSEVNKIKEYTKQYYNMGAFSQYISIFNRYIMQIKNEFEESEFHQFIVKYVISCVLKRQYDLGISELDKLNKNFYKYNYDVSIYVL